MDFVDGGFVGARRDNAVHQMGLDEVANFGFEGILQFPRAGREIDDLVGGMDGLLRRSKVLGRKKLEVVADWQHLSLGVKMINSRGVVASSDESQSTVLNHLQAVNGRFRILGVDDGRREVEERTDKSLEGEV